MAGALPRFYEHWLKGRYPEPVEATPVDCASCFMLKPTGLTRDLGPFKASLKCCTFHPYLPAFTLGALLTELDVVPSGDLAIALDHYFRSSRLTPLGAFPQKDVRPTSVCETGKLDETACAFLARENQDGTGAACTIRDFRPSTCAGYVCRSSQGAAGFKKWRTWESDLARFEWTLSHLAAFELGYTFDDADVAFTSELEARVYYRKAYLTAQKIDWTEEGDAAEGDFEAARV